MSEYTYKIKSGVMLLATISGDDRREAVNEAFQKFTEFGRKGFRDLTLSNIEREDYDLIDPKWDKVTVRKH